MKKQSKKYSGNDFRTSTEGIIKFRLIWKKKPLPQNLKIPELVMFRNMLASKGLIGADLNGTGFGNISINIGKGRFIISGSGTGRIKSAKKFHFTLVTRADLYSNEVECIGLYPASSETITHNMIYNLSNQVGCVIHVHNDNLWKKLLNEVPSTSGKIRYGTPEMALNIKKLWEATNLKELKILAMAGHENGIIVFGSDPRDAYARLIEQFEALN